MTPPDAPHGPPGRRGMLDRRQLLALAALTFGGRLFAAPPGSPRFLLVFLRGGYDALSLLLPRDNAFYAASRPRIAVTGGAPLDADWELAPAVRDSLLPLWQRRQLAFVPFAGIDDLSRSHFETQDAIEAGQPADGRRDSGFLGRLAGLLQGARPMAFTDTLPLVFRGADGVPNVSLRRVARPAFDARQSDLLADMWRGRPQHAAVVEGLDLRRRVASDLQGLEGERAGRGAVSAGGFELEARRIATLMREQYALGFVDVGGWDTHVAQPAPLARRLEELGRGLAAFAAAMGPAWDDTVVVVLSEFGRTFRENGSRGTDHGHGTTYWVLGGGVRGGRVAGAQAKLAPEALHQDRDTPVLNDCRALLAGLFQRLWGLSSEQIATVFPEAAPRDLGLL